MNSIAASEVVGQGNNGYIYVRGVVRPFDSLLTKAACFGHEKRHSGGVVGWVDSTPWLSFVGGGGWQGAELLWLLCVRTRLAVR